MGTQYFGGGLAVTAGEAAVPEMDRFPLLEAAQQRPPAELESVLSKFRSNSEPELAVGEVVRLILILTSGLESPRRWAQG